MFLTKGVIMEFEKLISERYSVRKFKQEHLTKECVDKILNAAHLAPTGCNYQPQRILVLNTDEATEKGHAAGRAEELVRLCREFGQSEKDILARLMKDLNLSKDEALQYMKER